MAAKAKLTDRQEAFCHEYVIDLNATRAAIRAGYAESGAGTEGARLLQNAGVRNRIQRLLNQRAAKRGLKAQTVINRLDDLGGLDPAEAFDDNGHLKMIHDIPREVRQGIKKVTYKAEWEGQGPNRFQVAEYVTVEFHDRIKANEILAKHLKIIDGDDDAANRLANSFEALVAGANPRSRDVTPKKLESGDDEEETSED